MGGKSSKGGSGREYSTFGSSSFNQYGYSHSQSYPQYELAAYPIHTATLTAGHSGVAQTPHRHPQLDCRYSRILDNYNTLENFVLKNENLIF